MPAGNCVCSLLGTSFRNGVALTDANKKLQGLVAPSPAAETSPHNKNTQLYVVLVVVSVATGDYTISETSPQ